jgi:hypothetical protein
LRRQIERLINQCKCDPAGGYSKPTLTILSQAHLLAGGHLGPMFSDQSYFTEPVTQALVDEIVAKHQGQPAQSRSGARDVYYVPDMGRFVGESPSGAGMFQLRRDVTMIVERNNCSGNLLRARNEIVTMYPGQ